MPLKDDGVFRHLPPLLRKAGQDTPAWPLARMLARTLNDLERTGRDVLQAHFLDDALDLIDLEKLAALYRLTPWLDEDLKAFRARVKLMISVYLRGAATADRMLTVAAAAAGTEVAEVTRPDRFTTMGLFTAAFRAAVVDLPPVMQKVVIDAAPDGKLEWQIENDLYGMPGGWTPDGWMEDVWPSPVVEIEAGAHDVWFPILVQRGLRRLVLVNRMLPAGCRVRVDLVTHTLLHVGGPPAVPTGLIVPPAEAGGPNLIYGTGALLGESGVSGHPQVVPAHVLKWYRPEDVIIGSDQPLAPGPKGAIAEPPAQLSWPSLLGDGTSQWRLLVGENANGGAFAPNQLIPLAQVRPVPPTPTTGPKQVTFLWEGRQLGTFTLVIDPARLAQGRRAWLEEQLQRLKLAGVLYVPWEKTTLSLALVSGALPS
ncbi:MAG TPA: hypothetical protein VNT75_07855 [Symbiobacteriaceae bacterium]|nr:hypothetical protein [Symbiobacteriaceae bacterium]